MNLLAIDTSSARCSLALALDDQVFEDTRTVSRKHNEVLLPMLDGLFSTAGCRPDRLQGVCFNAGPGSFTGVRLAAAAAQAVAFAADAGVAPIRSSALLAAWGHRQGVEQIVTSTRSRGQLYYLARYRQDIGCVNEDVLVESPPDWLAADAQIVGDRPPWLESACLLETTDPSPARTLLDLARTVDFLPPEQALPVYVQGDTPWKKATP